VEVQNHEFRAEDSTESQPTRKESEGRMSEGVKNASIPNLKQVREGRDTAKSGGRHRGLVYERNVN